MREIQRALFVLSTSCLITACFAVGPHLTSAEKIVKQRLTDEGKVCGAYRLAYVESFSGHVSAMSAGDKHQQAVERARLHTLADDETITARCTRPLCIIEPQQNGTLTTWCGYRFADTSHDEVHQWVHWLRVEPQI